jgi:ATP/maltotriose-dependent transcriptional regulator MalT
MVERSGMCERRGICASVLDRIAPGTVKKHLDHIYEKLGVSTWTKRLSL